MNRNPSPPRPTPWSSLPRDARDALFLLGVIAAVVVPLLPRLPGWCVALTLLTLSWRGLLAWAGRPLPPRWLRLALVLAAVGATVWTFRTILGRDPGVTLLVVLLALKTLELRARRDALVVFFLSFFLLLTQAFFSQSLPTAAGLLLAFVGLLAALVNAHMPLGRPPLAHSLRLATLITAMAAPVMAVLFVLFPRIGPLWGLPQDALSGRSGLSAHMTVGNVARLALDDGVAFRVRFDGPAPAREQLYFRGPVLTRLEGQRWSAAAPSQPLALAAPDLQPLDAGVRYEITQEPSPLPWLLVLDWPGRVLTPPTGDASVLTTPDLQMRLDAPVAERIRFRAESHLSVRWDVRATPVELLPHLQLPPELNPRTRQWAQELKARAPAQATARHWIDAVLQQLRTGGYSYTLEPGVYGVHSADEFWFDRKAGFCEHIAASSVILWRALGVPARVITGYQGGERNTLDGFWTVRQSDAHAWAEVWVQGEGWVRVDPTAAVAPARVGGLERLTQPGNVLTRVLMAPISPDVAQRLRMLWDGINHRWNQWVLNYGQANQFDWLKRLGVAQPAWADLLRILGAVAGLGALLAAAAMAWQRTRVDPWRRLLLQALTRWQRWGLVLPDSAALTPRALARAIGQRHPQLAAPWTAWLLALEAWRYDATRAPTPTPRVALLRLRRQLQRLPKPRPGA